ARGRHRTPGDGCVPSRPLPPGPTALRSHAPPTCTIHKSLTRLTAGGHPPACRSSAMGPARSAWHQPDIGWALAGFDELARGAARSRPSAITHGEPPHEQNEDTELTWAVLTEETENLLQLAP